MSASTRWAAIRNGSYKDLLPSKGEPLHITVLPQGSRLLLRAYSASRRGVRDRSPGWTVSFLPPYLGTSEGRDPCSHNNEVQDWAASRRMRTGWLMQGADERDSREEATAGTRLWDKLLIGAGSVSKSLTAKLKDEGYNSDSDEEGVDTHVIKALKDYYTHKGQGTPVWLGGTGSNVRPQPSTLPNYSNDGSMNPPSRVGKVSLKGIYEQAAERSSAQQGTSPRRGLSHLSRTGSNHPEQGNEFQPPRNSEDSARSGTSGRNQMSAGERFREKMKTNRTMSSQSGAGLTVDSNNPQGARSSRGSLEVPRDSAAMASRLKRGGGLTSNPSQGRF